MTTQKVVWEVSCVGAVVPQQLEQIKGRGYCKVACTHHGRPGVTGSHFDAHDKLWSRCRTLAGLGPSSWSGFTWLRTEQRRDAVIASLITVVILMSVLRSYVSNV